MVRQADIANGDFNGYLLLTDGLQLDAGMKAAGKTVAVSAIAAAVGNLADDPDAKLTAPQLANDPAADGYDGYVLVSQSQDKDAGKTRFTQYAVFLVGDRAEVAMRVAYGSRDKLDPLLAGMDALTYSMEFRNAGAPPPARLAAALPTDLAAITPKPKVNELAGHSGDGSSASTSGAGVVCRNEPQLIQRQSPVAASQGRFAMESFYGAKQVCRKNGKIVSVR
ncbi:MAG: hypothetical protein IPO97_05055 [Sphingomonadales bacterium]|nr:hypothetical protein [Sphingomonadales bacterium]